MRVYISTVGGSDWIEDKNRKELLEHFPHFMAYLGAPEEERPRYPDGFRCCGYIDMPDLTALQLLLKVSDKELCFSEKDGQYYAVYYNDYRE